MWLEATVWLWGPILGVLGAWSIWRNVTTARQLDALHERVSKLEAENSEKVQRRAA
jgi:hypothetical protein